MTHVTCRLTAKNRDQLRNPTLGNQVWATFFTQGLRRVPIVRPVRVCRSRTATTWTCSCCRSSSSSARCWACRGSSQRPSRPSRTSARWSASPTSRSPARSRRSSASGQQSISQSVNRSRFFYSGLSNLNHCEVH